MFRVGYYKSSIQGLHTTGLRKALSTGVAYHPCPFRKNIQGPIPISLSRKYLKKVH